MAADRQLATFLPPEMHEFLKAEAKRRKKKDGKTTMNHLIREALREKYPDQLGDVYGYHERPPAEEAVA